MSIWSAPWFRSLRWLFASATIIAGLYGNAALTDQLVANSYDPVMAMATGSDGYVRMAWASCSADGSENWDTFNYAYQDSGGMHTVSFPASAIGVASLTPINQSNDAPAISIALDSSNLPHIVFGASVTDGAYGDRDYWYGTYSGSGDISMISNWTFQRVIGYSAPSDGYLFGGACAIAIDPTVNRPAIAWEVGDANGSRSDTICYVTRTAGGAWPNVLLTNTGASTPPAPPSGCVTAVQLTGSDTAIMGFQFAIDASGNHHLVWSQTDNTTNLVDALMYATDKSGSWVQTTLQSGPSGFYLTLNAKLVLDANGYPRVAWINYNDNSGNLEVFNGTSWSNSSVIPTLTPADVGSYFPDVAYSVNSAGTEIYAMIDTEDTVNGGSTPPDAIRVATRAGGSGSWTIQTALTSNDPAMLGNDLWTSLDASNHAVVGYDLGWYFDTNGPGSVRMMTGTVSFPGGPTVTGISPTSGSPAGGTTVTVTGTNLSSVTAVSFGGVAAASFAVGSATQLTAVAPAGTGTVDITVTNSVSTSSAGSADQFTYVSTPTVSGVSPAAGPATGGGTVTITGVNFTGTTSVDFGGTAATNITVVNDTQITATAPAGTGTVDVTVTAPGGTSATNANDQYTYDAVPTVSGVSLAYGPLASGATVTITGTNFVSGSTVSFGATAATNVTVVSATSITATAPAGTGTVDVTVTSPGGTSATGSADQYTYLAAPAVTGISVSDGPVNGTTQVVLTGTGFTAVTAVDFGGVAATSYTVDSSTQITVTVPAGTAGSVYITVTAGGGTSATGSSNQYTYVTAPAVTGISPVAGPLGGTTSVTITGTNLSAASAVTFGTTAATSYMVNSATQITAVAPAESAGVVDVTVTTAGGTSATSTSDQFTYEGVPTVAALSQSYGPLAGGGTVTITGTNFTSDSTVSFGGTPAAVVTSNSPTSLAVTVPADSAGVVDVTVTSPGGTSATSASDHFTYLNAPTITGISVDDGPLSGTTQVVLTGTNFTDVTGVVFGTTAATSFTVNSPTQITVAAPAETAGTVNITVATGGGTSATGSADDYTYVAAPVFSSGASAAGLIGTAYTGTSFYVAAASNTPLYSIASGTLPTGMQLNASTGQITGTPSQAGVFTATLAATNAGGSVTLPVTFTIGKVAATVTLGSLAQTYSGSAETATATTNPGGLAVYFTYNGSSTPPTAAGSYSVVATISDNTYQGSVAGTLTIQQAPQTISVGTLPANASSARAFTLNATASSGLPVTYTITSGPGMISGSTVTPTGPGGTIVIVLSQAGNANYAPAPNVTIAVPIAQAGAREFFGTFTVTVASGYVGGLHPAAALSGTMAASINSTNTSGTLLGTVGGSGFVVTFAIGSDGTFSGTTTALTGPGSTVTGTLTFSGTLSGSTLSGTIAQLNASFSIAADPTAGSSSTIAGFYQGSSLDSSTGATYSLVGTQGEVLVVSVSPTAFIAGVGTVNANDTFTVSTTGGTVTGAINPATTAVTGTVTTASGTVSSFAGLSGTTVRTDRLINLSSSGLVTATNDLVSGFVIGGSANKTVLVRAVGPSLSNFGITNFLAHPHLQIFNALGVIISDSTSWGGSAGLSAVFAQTGAFPLLANSTDAAVEMSLAPGQYTMQISNAGTDAGGMALAEIYDASADPSAEYQRLINISSRAFVGSGANNLTGGFIVTGNDPKQLLIRGVGPGLTAFNIANALSNPSLTVFDSSGNILAQNDNWGTPITVSSSQVAASASAIVAAEAATGAFALATGSLDAAVIVTLPPGAYTAQVTGVGGLTGTALVEIYEIPASN